ncbi:unnamed protein product, partial [Mesorhabditis spiculigera]
MRRILLIFISLIPLALAATVDVQIKTSNVDATIRGQDLSYGYMFRGIPFALPPIGKLRFMPAARQDPSGLINATAYGQKCIQGNTEGDEDCLYLNVFTPRNATSDSKLPVWVWIFGGGFVEGSGGLPGESMYRNLINKGQLIIVSFNYRVGPLGFLTTRTKDAPGNGGISDAVEALNWVQRYIGFFGGDPRRVTVGGHSAGSEATSFVSLSPKASGLYSQLIQESGSAFGAAVMSYSDQTRDTSKQLAIKLGCATADEWNQGHSFYDIIACLQSKQPKSIQTADGQLPNHRMKWAPVQDQAYLPRRLEELALLRPPVPVLVGDVHDEWVGWDDYQVQHNLKWFTKTNVATSIKDCYEMSYWDNKDAVVKAAIDHYVNNVNFDENDNVNWAARHIQLFSEMVFIGPALRDAKYFAYTSSPVYLYSFDYLNPKAQPTQNNTKLRGVPHGYELQFVFGYPEFHDDPVDIKLTELMGNLWSNFVVYGDPTASIGLPTPFVWPKLQVGNVSEFVSIGATPSVGEQFHPDANFWVCEGPKIDGRAGPICK